MVGYQWETVGDAQYRTGHGELYFANGMVLDVDAPSPLRVVRLPLVQVDIL